MIVGDFSAEKPFVWKIGSIALKFSGEPPAKKAKESRLPKPVIQHMFRPPDKRASQTMSTAFTVMTLLPILILLAVVRSLYYYIWNLLYVECSHHIFTKFFNPKILIRVAI